MKVQIIFGSTREGRGGEKVLNWVWEIAQKRADVEFELIDLRDWNLPFYNDPNEASEEKYSYDYTIKWSAKISEADGYLIITPEYNHGYPAVLKNALDLLYVEWNKKPVAFISYGGSAGGARAVEQLRQVVAELKMVDIQEAIHLVRYSRQFDEHERITDSSLSERVDKVLNSLAWWVKKLKTD